MKRTLATLVTAPALLLAGLIVAPAAQALTTEAPSWGAANLLSSADSDFEAGTGTWTVYSNTTMTQDTTQAFHGADSLKLAATAAGTQVAAALGNATTQISVTGGDTYRESAWVKTGSAVSGRAITLADGFYNSSGTWLGWTYGTASTLASSAGWQYISETVTAPAAAVTSRGTPRVAEAGVAAGETLNLDEVLSEPYRAATVIGAKDPSTDASQFSTADAAIGPLQGDKMFYSGTLPASYSASNCAALPAAVTCIEAYKTQTTNVAAYVASIPAGRNTVLVYHQEPEGDYASGATFVSEFEGQSNLIRASATSSNRANVWVADDSGGYPYGTGRAGAGCTYTVPGTYTDFYFQDHYENPASGSNMAVNDPLSGSTMKSAFTNWVGCTGPQDKPLGIAEYGLNCPTTGTPDAATTYQAMAADNTLLESESLPSSSSGTTGPSYTRPVAYWLYWWYNNAGSCQFTTGGSPDGTQAVQQWQADENQNGGGAH